MLNPSTAIHVAAPGRVNLIGEHTDYTGGLVLPMAIPFTTRAVLTPTADGLYSFASAQFPEKLVLHQNDAGGALSQWSDYPVGVLRELQKLGIEPEPFLLEIGSDVPLGAGLSSSASVEVATCMALLRHCGRARPEREIALLCQRAENLFAGSPCGIMDQYAVTAARAGHALLLDTHDLSIEHLPMNAGGLGACVIVVVNSMVRHTVTAGSKYAERRRELEAGQAVLRERFGVRDLGQATLAQLEQAADGMTEASFRRSRHIITENARVREAAGAMRAGDAVRLGRLMTEAHVSERDDFECSVPEVDFLVDTALVQPGCYGARLTGGGFGGCTVNLVSSYSVEAFLTIVRKEYWAQFHIDAPAYVCEPANGAFARLQELGK